MAIKIDIPWETLLGSFGLDETEEEGSCTIEGSKISVTYLGLDRVLGIPHPKLVSKYLLEGIMGDTTPIYASALKAAVKGEMQVFITEAEKNNGPSVEEQLAAPVIPKYLNADWGNEGGDVTALGSPDAESKTKTKDFLKMVASPGEMEAAVGEMVAPAQQAADAMQALGKAAAKVPTAGDIQVTKIVTSAQCTLKNADAILQPVSGTSGGSVYHTIGIGPDFNVATRIKGKGPFDIALRIEGEEFDRAKVAKSLNMTLNAKGHVSMHLGLPKITDVSKVVGAVLFTLSSQLDAIASLDEINELFNKGSG